MKAVVLTAPQCIEVREIDKPEIGTEEVLVKLKYCGICTLEQRLYSGEMKIFYPIIPGHEACGVVEEIGEEVRRLRSDIEVGTPVALDLVSRCGECYYCRMGSSNLCQNRFRDGQRVLGGFAEYRAVSSRQVFPVPPDMPLQTAAFAEPVACCIRSLKKINLTLAEDLLIIGAGPMGLIHLQVGLCLGARVFVSDPDAGRLAMAEELGAALCVDPVRDDFKKVIHERTEGRGVDACIVTAQAPAALESAFTATGKNGRINIYTSYSKELSLPSDANTIHRSGVTITGSEGRTEADFLQAVRLLAFGKIKVSSLISETTSFAAIEEGIRSAMSSTTYRVLLDHEAG